MMEYINFGTNIETFILTAAISIGTAGLVFFLRLDWKRFGLLSLLSAGVANILCSLFLVMEFYSYPYRLFPGLSAMPAVEITAFFPLLVMIGVRYSPQPWAWKIPFYWTIIHLAMFFETLMLIDTSLIEYNFKWDLWDSYTWWWIYFLVFEWIGGLIIPEHLRKPLSIQHLHFGKLGWFIIHFILILTIFLGGYYLGSLR